NWKDSGSITTRIACTLRSTAAHRQKSLPKLPAAMLTSADSNGNLIAVGYTSYPWQLEQQFAMHRFAWGDIFRPLTWQRRFQASRALRRSSANPTLDWLPTSS
ncbi:MAG: hypothetical protein WBR56_06520, partial [Sedimenticolaceae bacterium]